MFNWTAKSSAVLAPILMGFDPNLAILTSRIGTLIFFVVTGGKVPAYLGFSLAFIGVAIAATAYAGKGPDANLRVALGGVVACGVALVAVVAHGMVQRLLILVGLVLASIIDALLTKGLALGKPMDLSGIASAVWVGLPGFTAPVFNLGAMLLMAPVAIILVAENLGNLKAVTAVTGKNMDRFMGRAFIGNSLATIVWGGAGGTGVTTYAVNIGVMAATKIYLTAVFPVAALMAVVLCFSPEFGQFALSGIGTATFGAILLWALLSSFSGPSRARK